MCDNPQTHTPKSGVVTKSGKRIRAHQRRPSRVRTQWVPGTIQQNLLEQRGGEEEARFLLSTKRIARGHLIPVRRQMTESDKATDGTLTEGANALATARAYQCPLGTTHRCLCPQRDQHLPGCECLRCATARYWKCAHQANEAPTKEERDQWEPYLQRRQREVDVAAEHTRLATEAHRKRALHERNKANALSKLGPWEFTLTYSPTKHGWNREEAMDAMRTACERLIRYYREEIEEFHAVGELTAQGAPHVHAWYKLDGGRKITTKSFRRAYPIWNERTKLGRGHEGGHHEPIKRTADFAGYIEKDLDTAWLILNITNEPDEAQARLQEAEDDHPSESDGTASPPDSPAESDDGELRECS